MSITVLCTSQTRQSTCNIRHAVGLERVWVEGIPLMNCSLSLMCKCSGHLGRIRGNPEVIQMRKAWEPSMRGNAHGRGRPSHVTRDFYCSLHLRVFAGEKLLRFPFYVKALRP